MNVKQVFRIAKLELKTLFFSPIAWLVFLFFIIQASLDFVPRITWLFEAKEQNYKWGGITGSNYRDFWFYIQKNMLFYIPLLTMGLMSKERSSGTIRLLLSSPVRSAEIVLGKYLSMMVLGLIFIVILTGAILVADSAIIDQDNKLMISALIGTYLLICAYSAVGLFISNLTSYQVVSVIGTLAIFELLDMMRDVWQDKDFFRELTFFLALSGRSQIMVLGLISTDDLAYFLLIVLMFLGFVVIRMETVRRGIPGLKKAMCYCLYTAVILMLGYATTRPTHIAYFDMTATKNWTLTKQSQEVVKKIQSPLSVEIYTNVLDERWWEGNPGSTIGNRMMFYNYQQYLPEIKFHSTFYYDTAFNEAVFNKKNRDKPLDTLVKLHFDNQDFIPKVLLKPAEMKAQLDMEDEDHRTVKQLRIGDKKTFLRYYHDLLGNPGQEEITAALMRLTDGVQTVGFVRGHGERDITKLKDNKGYKLPVKENTFRFSLKNYGFDIRTINLQSSAVLDSVSILVIADPSDPFMPEELQKVHDYVAKGGNLLVMGEPGNQAVLNAITAQVGVEFLPGRVIQKSKDFGPEYIVASLTGAAMIQDTLLLRRAVEEKFKVEMDGAVALAFHDTAGFSMKRILIADSSNSRVAGDTHGSGVAMGASVPQGSPILAMALSRPTSAGGTEHHNKEQRVMIMGDADFMTNEVINSWDPIKPIAKTRANFDMYTSAFRWLSGDRFPTLSGYTRAKDKDSVIVLTEKGLSRIDAGASWVLPGIVLLLGSLFILRRKRK